MGGLLLVQEGGNSYLPAYDALGNIHAMIKASDGSLAAAYEYDAFGNTLRESGPYAASNPFRFATKYADLETGLVQYNTRYYSPSLGRFINRDTISEQGGLNLYAYCGNNGVNHWDYLGNVFDGINDALGFAAADHMDYSRNGTSSGVAGGGVWGGSVYMVEESLVSFANRITDSVLNATIGSSIASTTAFIAKSEAQVAIYGRGSDTGSKPEITGAYDGYGTIGEIEFLGWSFPAANPTSDSPSIQTVAPNSGGSSSSGAWDAAEQAVTFAGAVAGGAEMARYAKDPITGMELWKDAQGTLRTGSFNGNGATGGKLKFARAASGTARVVGRGLFVVGAAMSVYDIGAGIAKNDTRRAVLGGADLAVGAIATFGGPIGWVVGAGYFGARWLGAFDRPPSG